MPTAQVVTVTVESGTPMMDCLAGGIAAHREPCTIKVAWTSTDGGAVSAALATLYAAAQVRNGPKPTKIRGYLVRVKTVPGAAGVTPSDNYDAYLNDPNSVDIAEGGLVDRDDTNSEDWAPTYQPVWIDHEVTLVIANAGDANSGTVYLYLVP